eukprot:TRINITY_DN59110_c0_g1_i1.p1 TRINITY_DN59110_c0_g1~~TRINITY_DN59110_c0_g1_i1.p1  ORF type:complete len:1851 (-),score=452.78 TRINITY_DN59110_c0_g1_i1:236-5788(-)
MVGRPAQPVQVSDDVHGWLLEFGLLPKARATSARGGPTGQASQVLPPKVVAGLLSGESFASLLSAIFRKHRIKFDGLQTPGSNPEKAWEQVCAALQKLDVDLDTEMVAKIISGDTALLVELLSEIHQVYGHWAAAQAKATKKKQQRAPEQKAAARQASRGRQAGQGERQRERASSDAPASDNEGSRSVSRSGRDRSSSSGRQVVVVEEPSPSRSRASGSPTSARAFIRSQQGSHAGSHAGSRAGSRAASRLDDLPKSADAGAEASCEGVAESLPHVGRRSTLASGLSEGWWMRGVEEARSAPELLALSMLRELPLNADQVCALLADGAIRLADAFADGHARNCQRLATWLETLSCYAGPLVELLIQEPPFILPILSAIGHGLRGYSLDVATGACKVLSSLCSGIVASKHSRVDLIPWLRDTQALRDLTALLGRCSGFRSQIGAILVSCAFDWRLVLEGASEESCSLDHVLLHRLRDESCSEQEYLSVAHLLLLDFLENRPDVAEACAKLGIMDCFLLRALRRVHDDRSAVPTRQAAAMMACDLWMAGTAAAFRHAGQRDLAGIAAVVGMVEASPSSFEALLQGLLGAVRSPWQPLRAVALSLLARLLDCCFKRRDALNTPAVFAMFVSAILEAPSPETRDFALRLIMPVLKRYEMVPVGILLEPLVKQWLATQGEALQLTEIELCSAVVRHPRCTLRHAEMLAHLLARASVESLGFARASTVPLLLVLQRFSEETSMVRFFENFVQMCLARLIQRGANKDQSARIHEVLAKIVSVQLPRLESILRAALGEISRAYLMGYQALHPNLQALVDLWPLDAASMRQWAGNKAKVGAEASAESGGDGPTVGFELPRKTPTPMKQRPTPTQLDLEEDGHKDITVKSPVASSTVGTRPSGPFQQLEEQTAKLRDEIEEAKVMQNTATQEAEALRQDLQSAHEAQAAVETEVERLRKRKELLVEKRKAGGKTAQPAGAEKKRRDVRPPKGPPSAEDLEQAKLLAQSFREPLEELFMNYGTRRRSSAGKFVQLLHVDSLDSLLGDLGLLPQRLQPKAVQKVVQTTYPKLDPAGFSPEEFVGVLPHVAHAAFDPEESQPFRDFGVAVAMEGDGAVRREFQALLVRLDQLCQTSSINTLRTVRFSMQRARRQYVLQYAKKKLLELNAELASAGKEQTSPEATAPQKAMPEGFALVVKAPPPVYALPADLPVPASFRYSTEILDEVLFKAVGMHFLEPVGPRDAIPQAIVAAHPDLEALEREVTEPPKVEQRPKPVHRKPPQPRAQQPSAAKPSNAVSKAESKDEQRVAAGAAAGSSKERSAASNERKPAGVSAGASAQRGRSQERSPPRNAAATKASQKPAQRPVKQSRERSAEKAAPQKAVRAAPEAKDDSPQRNGAATNKARRPPASRPRKSSRERSTEKPADKPGEERAASSVPPDKRQSMAPKREKRAISQQPERKGGASATKSSNKSAGQTEAGEDTSGKQRDDASPRSGKEAPAAAAKEAPKHRKKFLQRHQTQAELGKDRKESFRDVLASDDIQKKAQACEPGLKRVFELFSNWKGGAKGNMELLGFLKLGECFGLLNKEQMKSVFSQLGGQGFASGRLVEALLLCLMKGNEAYLSTQQLPLSEEAAIWRKDFHSLLAHMAVARPKEVQATMDNFRRTGDGMAKFALSAQAFAPPEPTGRAVDKSPKAPKKAPDKASDPPAVPQPAVDNSAPASNSPAAAVEAPPQKAPENMQEQSLAASPKHDAEETAGDAPKPTEDAANAPEPAAERPAGTTPVAQAETATTAQAETPAAGAVVPATTAKAETPAAGYAPSAPAAVEEQAAVADPPAETGAENLGDKAEAPKGDAPAPSTDA